MYAIRSYYDRDRRIINLVAVKPVWCRTLHGNQQWSTIRLQPERGATISRQGIALVFQRIVIKYTRYQTPPVRGQHLIMIVGETRLSDFAAMALNERKQVIGMITYIERLV